MVNLLQATNIKSYNRIILLCKKAENYTVFRLESYRAKCKCGGTQTSRVSCEKISSSLVSTKGDNNLYFIPSKL